MTVMVKVVLVDGEVHFSAKAGKQVWRKEYFSLKTAASDAEELGIIGPDMERILGLSGGMPGYPPGLEYAVEINPDDFARLGFLQAVTLP